MSPARRRLLGLTRPHLGVLSAATVAGFVALFAGIAVPVITEHLVNNAISKHHRGLIIPLVVAALVISLLRAAANWGRRWYSGVAAVRIEAHLRYRLFTTLQAQSIAFHDEWHSGQLIARATSDLETIKNFVGYGITFLGFVVITSAGVVVAIAVLSPLIAVLMAVLMVPWVVAAGRFNTTMEVIAADSRQWVGEVTNVVSESAAGIRILKAFGVERGAAERLSVASTRLLDVNLDAVRRRAFFIPLLNMLPNLVLGIVLGVGGFQVIDGALSVGGLVAITGYLYMLVVPMRYVGWMLALAQQAEASCDRVFEILEAEPTITDRPGATALDAVAGNVTFDHVTFSYPRSAAPVLRDFTLSIEAGETVAIVGATGSGKSTIAALLPRFLDPDTGCVRIDGHDLRDVTRASLRRHIGVVFDDPVLFSATIAENIAFGYPEASEADVEAAARAAGAHGFVSSLPAAYATPVGEQGLSLSGGQRQRLALARALAQRPRVLVLDDPLSSVDVRTEAQIEANLRSLLGTCTTVIIANRASTVAMADRVVLLDEGRVVASGSHTELLMSNETYRRILAADVEIEELAQ